MGTTYEQTVRLNQEKSMGFLERLRFKFFDSGEMIASLIEQWHPRKCNTEKDYEKSLYRFLHNKLEDIQVTKQFARGRIRADLVVGDNVIVELKNNLKTTARYQRLVGQITVYKEWDGQIIIVLVGETDPNLYKEVMKHAESHNDDLGEDKIIVIKK